MTTADGETAFVAGERSFVVRQSRDDVHILTGAHGRPNGTTVADARMYADDVKRFGDLPSHGARRCIDVSGRHQRRTATPRHDHRWFLRQHRVPWGVPVSGAGLARQDSCDWADLREFVGFVWTDNWLDPAGMLVEATDVSEAVEVVRSFHSGWHVSLWNEEDAARARIQGGG